MPKINLCFLWHMHQPLYKDPINGEYRLPWVRMHALKDYFGMVKILDDFPQIHQTFNLVPSLLNQLQDYVSGNARDPFLTAAMKPAENLTPQEKEFILNYFFQANEQHVIRRYPRYAELFSIVQRHNRNLQFAAGSFDAQMFRDLQVLSQIAWFDEYDLDNNPAVRALAAKGRMYTIEDQRAVGEHETAAMARVLPAYREAAERGQIELSASPYYHPILPLLCDSNIANVSHLYVPLPQQFAYPQDAEEQLRRACSYFESELHIAPSGFWPSEGSISEATLQIASRMGFRWTASDNGVLARCLDTAAAGEATYRPYRWQRDGDSIHLVFRDRRLSDLIAFVYAEVPAQEAVAHFLSEMRKCCAPVLNSGRDALVPIIMDGENAWESYPLNGRPFLRALYSEISKAPDIRTMTISRGIASVPAADLPKVVPGSWIDANFDIWIGAEEDNAAWEQLAAARKTYEEAIRTPREAGISEEAKQAAFEEILVAEGSDWCWWYGPEHPSANQGEFDQLYRDHLANVYRLLEKEVPPELSIPISGPPAIHQHEVPNGFIQPQIDGVLSSRGEWSNAGMFRMGRLTGEMHGRRPLLHDLHYGTDGQSLYIRVDLSEPLADRPALEFVLRLRTAAGEYFEIRADARPAGTVTVRAELPESALQVAIRDIFEARVSMSAMRVRLGDPVHLRLTALRDGLPFSSLPPAGELELRTGTLAAYAF